MGKAANQRRVTNHSDVGAAFESKVIDAVGHACWALAIAFLISSVAGTQSNWTR